MGKVEKVVVVSVLFLITLILAVSLPGKDPKPSAADGALGTSSVATPPAENAGSLAVDGAPESGAVVPPAAAPATGAEPEIAAAAPEIAAAAAPTQPDTLLSATVKPGAPAASAVQPAAGASIPAGSILVSTDGLEESYLPDYRFYAWKQDDNWRTIAGRFYGNPTMAPVLRRANEGRTQVAAGEKILVPVFAPDAAPTAAGNAMSAAPTTAAAAPKTAPDAAGNPHVYVVAEGDSLWRISKKVYGAGARWNEIFTANRDVLASPDDLATGQRLRIP